MCGSYINSFTLMVLHSVTVCLKNNKKLFKVFLDLHSTAKAVLKTMCQSLIETYDKYLQTHAALCFHSFIFA